MNRNTRNPDNFIPFALPCLGSEEERAVIDVLRTGWLTTGTVALSFEQDFAERIGAAKALATNSATAGLHLVLKALGIPEGARVITCPFTFAASAEVIRHLGAHPYFVDCEPDGFNIDPGGIEKALLEKRNIKAVLPVHIGGEVCSMGAICESASRRNIPVIEDAAHAFPVNTDRGYAGTLGTAGVFSFYATKTITTGEGGMVVTNNPDLADSISILRLHGIDRVIWDRYRSDSSNSWEYDVVDAGYKYNMPDLLAAVGREQLKKADLFLEKRTKIAHRYIDVFQDLDFLKLPGNTPNHAWHLFILRIVPDRLTISRDEYIRLLAQRGIGTSVHFKPLHLMTYYKKLYGFKPEDFPKALASFECCFSLPIYPGLTESSIQYIINQVTAVGKEHYNTTHAE